MLNCDKSDFSEGAYIKNTESSKILKVGDRTIDRIKRSSLKKIFITEARSGSPIEYIRHGMVKIFIDNEPLKGGKRLVEITGFKTKKD